MTGQKHVLPLRAAAQAKTLQQPIMAAGAKNLRIHVKPDQWAGHAEGGALTFRPVSGSFSSLSRTFSSVMVSCSGRMFAMGSGAQWLLKTCTGSRPAFPSQQRGSCNSDKDPDTHCTTWCTPMILLQQGPRTGTFQN